VSLNLVSLKKKTRAKSGLEQTNLFICVPDFGFAKKKTRTKSGLEQTNLFICVPEFGFAKKRRGSKSGLEQTSLFVCGTTTRKTINPFEKKGVVGFDRIFCQQQERKVWRKRKTATLDGNNLFLCIVFFLLLSQNECFLTTYRIESKRVIVTEKERMTTEKESTTTDAMIGTGGMGWNRFKSNASCFWVS